MQTDNLELMVKEVLAKMAGNGIDSPAPAAAPATPASRQASVQDYPVLNKHPEWIKTATGKGFDEVTVDNIMNGQVTDQDMRITPDVLRIQAQIARDAGRNLLAENFERAAELTAVPDERVLEIYNALRPYRSSKEELMGIAQELEQTYNAKVCAGFVREAAELYQQRRKLKGDD